MITYQIGETRHINTPPNRRRSSVPPAYLHVSSKAVIVGAKVPSVEPPSVFVKQLTAERDAPNIASRIMRQVEESSTRRRSIDGRMTTGIQKVSSVRLIRTGSCLLQICTGLIRLPSFISFAPSASRRCAASCVESPADEEPSCVRTPSAEWLCQSLLFGCASMAVAEVILLCCLCLINFYYLFLAAFQIPRLSQLGELPWRPPQLPLEAAW